MTDQGIPPDIVMRPARAGEGATLAAIRAASITQLCDADHGKDENTVRRWIGSGTSERFESLVGDRAATVVVAECGGVVAGFGARSGDRITLNYVHPDWRFRGVSSAVLASLEHSLLLEGITRARLESTATALAFYRARGWTPSGDGSRDLGYPMIKALGG